MNPRPFRAAAAAFVFAFLAGTGCTGRAGALDFRPTPGGKPLASGCAELPPRPEVKEIRRWSDARTWDGDKPAAGANVHIPKGRRVILDESTPPLGVLTIDGELEFAEEDLELTAADIHVHGALYVGSAERPYTHRGVITLTGAQQGQRGIHVMNGRLELCAEAPKVIWTRLGAHAEAGAQALTLEGAVDWSAGDELVIAPTDYYGRGETERVEVRAVDGAQVTLAAPLVTGRWGVLQHVTRQGVALEPDPEFVPPATPFPRVLDERAEVGNVSRRLVIQGADDAAWQEHKRGAHVMVMGPSAIAAVDGVQLRRAGHAGQLGHYPLHLHLLSYALDGTERATQPIILRRNAVVESMNRCVVIHGTNGAQVQENICFDVRGHAVFLEDAVERRNVIERNLVLKVRAPAPEHRLLRHDGNVFQGGPSGFWLTNPDNEVRGNVAGDAEGNGFWLSFPKRPLGPSAHVPLKPEHLAFGVFDDNVAHSNAKPGLNMDWIPVNPEGDVLPNMYTPTSDGEPPGWSKLVRFPLRRIQTWKNNDHGFWNRGRTPDYEEWISADNVGTFFAGAGYQGRLTRSLVIAKSLNTPTPYPSNEPPVGVASYHSTFDIDHNVFVGFDFVPGKSSGVFKTDDYYVRAVDLGPRRNPSNMLIASHPGYRTPPFTEENWTLAGALWDAHGYFGEPGRYWVYDTPFLTSEAECTPVPPAGQNGASCTGPYYGVGGFILNRETDPFIPLMPIRAERQTAQGEPLGVWEVGDGALAPKLGHMRHFATRRGGRYTLDFPGWAPPTEVKLTVDNAWREDDSFLLGIVYSGAQPAQAYVTTYHLDNIADAPDGGMAATARRRLTQVATLDEVIAGNGDRFWQDTANDRVWLKFRGGLPYLNVEENPLADSNLYKPVYVRVYPAP